jgi:UDP-N-acetylmuramate--alanine ligase
LASFDGIQRRFEVKGEADGVLVVDDYAHHPEEIRVTLRAAREGSCQGEPSRRLVALFQPHRYSRTQELFDEFLSAFDDADTVFLTEIYPAGEERREGVSGEVLCQAIRKRGHTDVRFVAQREALAHVVRDFIQPGDMVITLGAGDIHRTGVELLDLLRKGAGSAA